MPDAPPRSPSGVRLAGDDYQHLVTWNVVLLALRPGSGAATVTVEDRDAGNVDDIVIRYHDGQIRYLQVKHTVDSSTPVGAGWLMASRGRGRSLLKKFFDSWKNLGTAAHLELVTDRGIDA